MAGQHVDLFGQVSEHDGIAPFQPHDRLARLGQRHQFGIDFGLGPDTRPTVLPETDPFGGRRCMLQNGRIDQVVVQDDVGLLQTLAAA